MRTADFIIITHNKINHPNNSFLKQFFLNNIWYDIKYYVETLNETEKRIFITSHVK